MEQLNCENGVDFGIFCMRYMETYKGQKSHDGWDKGKSQYQPLEKDICAF